MASVTITQVQLQSQTPTDATPTSLYWSTNTEIEMSINPNNIAAVGYVFDVALKTYVAGIIQIYLIGSMLPIYSTNSYASIVAYMNPVIP